MLPQIDKKMFQDALMELGHDPNQWIGKRLTLSAMSELYEIKEDQILEAISRKAIDAHYDYKQDTIWVDALDAAHFFYCVKNEAHLYSSS